MASLTAAKLNKAAGARPAANQNRYEEMFAILTSMNDKVDATHLKRVAELADEDGMGWIEWADFREVQPINE